MTPQILRKFGKADPKAIDAMLKSIDINEKERKEIKNLQPCTNICMNLKSSSSNFWCNMRSS